VNPKADAVRSEAGSQGLSRARLVSAALELVGDEGLEALSMRALADRLHVKAASLYWHVRDRRDLLELLADSILDGVKAPPAAALRPAVLGIASALAAALGSQRDADRILLEIPEALQRSRPHELMKERLQKAGMQAVEAAEVARLVMVHVVISQAGGEPAMPASGATASIAVDSGSRGVILRHGTDMETLIRIPHDPAAAAPAIVRGETVKVRRLRGVGHGEIELNPRHPWRFQIQGPTWNTVLDVGGLNVKEIKLDSGAAKVDCNLPHPRGVVPIIVSGGVVGLNLHRPAGVAVVAEISAGVVRIKLDALSIKATVTDLHWESEGASGSPDRYELRVNGGAVQVSLDDMAKPEPASRQELELPPSGEAESALDILMDGVESRLARRSAT
jgi:AcrR family transcriptional regulator